VLVDALYDGATARDIETEVTLRGRPQGHAIAADARRSDDAKTFAPARRRRMDEAAEAPT
jgi:hypothetical protein